MLGELRARLSAAPAADYGGGFVGIDFSGTRAVLHKLKGSALTLGACAVGACCEDLRQHCIAGNAAAIHAAGGPGSFAELVAKTQQVLGACMVAAAAARAAAKRVVSDQKALFLGAPDAGDALLADSDAPPWPQAR